MSVWHVHTQESLLKVAPLGNMLQQSFDGIFKDLPNLFGITDYI